MRAPGWLLRHGEWVFVAVAFVVALSGTIGTDPQAQSGAYMATTFGTGMVVVGAVTLWLARGDRTDDRRAWWVGLLGVPLAIYLAALPDLLAGHLNDDRTGTAASSGLFALVLAACVPAGMLVGFLVLLPLGLLARGLALAATGRVEGLGLVLIAGLPLSIVAGAVSGAIAMDNVPSLSDSWGSMSAGGLAMMFRAFGIENGIVVVNHTALIWCRVFAVIFFLYVAAIVVGSRSASREEERDRRSGEATTA